MPIISQRRRTTELLLLIIIFVALNDISFQPHGRGVVVNADVYDEYVKEVLEEDEGNHQHENDHYSHEDAYYERQKAQQQDADKRKRAEEERIAQEQADRVALERERAFQAELERMNTDKQKAALIRQKKNDAKVVKSVLKAAQLEDLYQVLGIRNWNIKIPSRSIRIPLVGRSVTIPGITIKETTMKDIRKAYRNRAMAVHPDKNRDGRAQEAFILVEESASILSDNLLRQQYDKQLALSRRLKRDSQMQLVSGVLNSLKSSLLGFLKAIRVLLGPFATPVIILGLLMA